MRPSHSYFGPSPCGPGAWWFTSLVKFRPKRGTSSNAVKIGRKENVLVVARQRTRPNVTMGYNMGTNCPSLLSVVAS